MVPHLPCHHPPFVYTNRVPSLPRQVAKKQKREQEVNTPDETNQPNFALLHYPCVSCSYHPKLYHTSQPFHGVTFSVQKHRWVKDTYRKPHRVDTYACLPFCACVDWFGTCPRAIRNHSYMYISPQHLTNSHHRLPVSGITENEQQALSFSALCAERDQRTSVASQIRGPTNAKASGR